MIRYKIDILAALKRSGDIILTDCKKEKITLIHYCSETSQAGYNIDD